jgi:hypothetical protein
MWILAVALDVNMKYNAAHLISIINFVVDQGGEVSFCDFPARYPNEEYIEDTNGAFILETLDTQINSKKLRTVHEIVFTLLHEAGHLMSYKHGMNPQLPEKDREIRAFLYGWAIAKKLGIPLEKATWRRVNYIFKAPAPSGTCG